jgi:hypothetical protein
VDYDVVFGLGPDDVWAGGSEILVHYDGDGWSEVPYEGNCYFSDMWCSRTDDCWVACTYSLMHWDGAEWTWADLSPDSEWGIGSIWGSASDDVWAVGAIRTPGQHGGFDEYEALLLHYDGHGWQQQELAQPDDVILQDIWGTGGEYWMIGRPQSMSQALCWHFDGQTWSQVILGSSEFLNGIHGTPDGHIWVAGDNAAILRYPP